ncbi:MAG: hypothetical protein FJ295_12025 [Planctomycetes bacterium]|nr:hypothetical protein [Planctomycetota bacterium]
MRAWKLLTLLALAGFVPFGLAQEQWIAQWRDWIRSIPVSTNSASPPLQTYPSNSNTNNNGGNNSSGYSGSTSGGGSGSTNSSNQGTGNSPSWTNTPTPGSSSSQYGGSSNTAGGTAGGSGGGSASSSTSGTGSNSLGNSAGSSASNKAGSWLIGNANEPRGTNSISGDSRSGSTPATNSNSLSNGSARPDDFEPGIEGPSFQELHEVFRFDLHPKAIFARWPRVTTVLAEPALEGLRVPLVTGKDPDDLSGALTYYFDQKKVVQRITFQGYTGDEHRLVELATELFGMKTIPTLGAGLYMVSWNGKPRSVLRLTFAPVVRANDPHHRIEVMLEINRPRAYYSLSKEFQEVLDHDKANARF